MSSKAVYITGSSAALIITLVWIIWALLPGQQNSWRSFEALGVLISGLSFVGLIVTVSVQLSAMKDNDRATRQAILVQQQVSAIHALSSVRSFSGSRIEHLNKHIAAKDTMETDGISEDQAKVEIAKIRELIPRLEAELSKVSEKILSSMRTDPSGCQYTKPEASEESRSAVLEKSTT